jgi:hypothetical protein
MCADPRGKFVKIVGRHVGSKARVFDATQSEGTPEAMDPEREKQVHADEAALEAWLRSRGGQPWFEGIVMKCVERFPGLDRFQVSAVIYKLGAESAASQQKERAEESIKRRGFDIGKLSEKELDEFLGAYSSSPEAAGEVWERLKKRHGNQQGDKKEEGAPRADPEAGEACERVTDFR